MAEIIIYADDNVNVAIVEGLRRRGLKAYSCTDFRNKGSSDEEQIAFAQSKHFVVLTHDTDFLRAAHEHKLKHSGIIFVSQTKLNIGEIIRKVEYLMSLLSA